LKFEIWSQVFFFVLPFDFMTDPRTINFMKNTNFNVFSDFRIFFKFLLYKYTWDEVFFFFFPLRDSQNLEKFFDFENPYSIFTKTFFAYCLSNNEGKLYIEEQ